MVVDVDIIPFFHPPCRLTKTALFQFHQVLKAGWDMVRTVGNADGRRFRMITQPSRNTAQEALRFGCVQVHARLIQEEQFRVRGQGFFHQGFRRFAEVGLHFGTDHPYFAANLAQFLSRLAFLSEHRDIVRIAERTISRNQRKERGLPAAVMALQNPMFAAPHGPVEVPKKPPLAEADANIPEFQ